MGDYSRYMMNSHLPAASCAVVKLENKTIEVSFVALRCALGSDKDHVGEGFVNSVGLTFT